MRVSEAHRRGSEEDDQGQRRKEGKNEMRSRMGVISDVPHLL